MSQCGHFRLLLTLADPECRGVTFWLELGRQLASSASPENIAVLESLALSLEHEQARLEKRLQTIG